MKKNDIWLTPKEIQLMLQGSLQWTDIKLQNSSRPELRKIRENTLEKVKVPKPSEPKETDQLTEKEWLANKLEGKPVVLLLGSVGLLTLSSWFYFVIFAK